MQQGTKLAQVQPALTEQQLVAICERLMSKFDFGDDYKDIILLVQGIAGQPDHLACRDAADAVTDHLFANTPAFGDAKENFLVQLLHDEANTSELAGEKEDGD